MISAAVTNRYAEALFELARERGELERIAGDVEFLAAEMSIDSVASFMSDRRVPAHEKKKRLEFLEAHVHPLTYNFVRLLLDKNRLEVLRSLGDAFRQRLLAARGAVEGVVESARPLGPAELAELEASLGLRLAKQVHLVPRLAPELLGGVRVILQNRMLDQSLRGRLEGLRTALGNVRVSASQAP